VSEQFDFVVIGAGSAGLLAAPLAAKLGVRVALVERDRPGGDCLFTGCVPSKALLRVAQAAHDQRHAVRFGLAGSEPTVDMVQVSAHIQEVIGRIYEHDRPEALERQGVSVLLGAARFVDSHTIQAGGKLVRGKRFLLCTGSRPARPSIPGLDRVPYLTYEDLFTLKTLPRRLLVVGGGPVGVEMSQAFARLGSMVTLIQRNASLLPAAESDCAGILTDVLRDEGVNVRLGLAAERVEQDGDAIAVVAGGERFTGDALLVATGRVPVVDGLGLERAGVAHGARGIRVNAYLQTSQPHIYACGDVIGGEQFTHLAATQAYQATRNALLPGRTRTRSGPTPWAVFTDPEVARAGLTEAEARARFGRDVRSYALPLARVDRAQASEDRHGLVKLIYRGNGTIIGAHIVAARAGEMLQEAIAAIDQRKTLGQLAAAVHVYPTYAVGLQQAASYALEESLFSGHRGRIVRVGLRLLTRLA